MIASRMRIFGNIDFIIILDFCKIPFRVQYQLYFRAQLLSLTVTVPPPFKGRAGVG